MLPKHHLSADSKDVIKVAMAMVATLAALVVGLLIASAKNSFDGKDTEMRRIAADAVLLDRTMAMDWITIAGTLRLLRHSMRGSFLIARAATSRTGQKLKEKIHFSIKLFDADERIGGSTEDQTLDCYSRRNSSDYFGGRRVLANARGEASAMGPDSR